MRWSATARSEAASRPLPEEATAAVPRTAGGSCATATPVSAVRSAHCRGVRHFEVTLKPRREGEVVPSWLVSRNFKGTYLNCGTGPGESWTLQVVLVPVVEHAGGPPNGPYSCDTVKSRLFEPLTKSTTEVLIGVMASQVTVSHSA